MKESDIATFGKGEAKIKVIPPDEQREAELHCERTEPERSTIEYTEHQVRPKHRVFRENLKTIGLNVDYSTC